MLVNGTCTVKLHSRIIIDARISEAIEINLKEEQIAFRKGKPAIKNIFILTRFIKKNRTWENSSYRL